MGAIDHRFQRDKALRSKIFVEPSTKAVRPYLVEYVLLQIEDARKVSDKEELLRGRIGYEVATNICGALAWQDAKGVNNSGWLTPTKEPVLAGMLNESGVLDADANHPDAWQRLFDLARQLK